MRIRLLRGDITRQRVDAIVNAANQGLRGGGGVDGAIHRVGGPAIMEDCDRIRTARGGCPTGSAVATGAGDLDARAVIHAVGPRWSGGGRGEAGLLAGAYRSSLRLAAEAGLRVVAFPSLSTGAYGFPLPEAADIAIATVLEFLDERPEALDEIRFVLFCDEDLAVYRGALARLSGDG